MVQRQMTRLPDWRARLCAEMERQSRIPFVWGRHDCVLGLAAGAVEAITGEDLRIGLGGYRSASGARRVLRARGFAGLGEALAALLPEVHPVRADAGDLGLIDSDGPVGAALCVIDSSGLIVMTDTGHGRRPRSDLRRAFRIG